MIQFGQFFSNFKKHPGLCYSKLLFFVFRWGKLRVSVLNVTAPLTVLPEVSVQDAIDIMNREGFDQLPVVGKTGYGSQLALRHSTYSIRTGRLPMFMYKCKLYLYLPCDVQHT